MIIFSQMGVSIWQTENLKLGLSRKCGHCIYMRQSKVSGMNYRTFAVGKEEEGKG